MTDIHASRIQIISELAAGEVNLQDAASSLGLSIRQVERLRSSFNRRGAPGLAHGNSERKAKNAFQKEVCNHIVELATGKYSGFNHTYLTEMLNEVEGIAISRSSVRNILLAANHPSEYPRRCRVQRRHKRQRKSQEGVLLQIDGSTHRWCGANLGKATLISAIDDATNRLWCVAREGEDLEGYMLLLKQIILTHGIPRMLYTDRSALAAGQSQRFKMVESTQLGPSQLQRAMRELGSSIILANSPQPKDVSNVSMQHSRTAW